MKSYRLYQVSLQRLERALRREVRAAWRRHGSVRKAADALGMPRMTFHDLAREIGIDMSRSAS